LPILLLDMVLPYLTYRYLIRRAPGMPLAAVLAWTTVFPAAANILSVVRRRRLDIIGIIVLTGIVMSIGAVRLGGDPRILLIRESFVTGTLGLLSLVSLTFPRPLMFYVGREFMTGNDPARVAEFDALWQLEGARHSFRVITVVWGVGWLAECVLRAVMTFTLPVGLVLVVAPLLLAAITVGMILWTVRYAALRRAAGEAARRAATVRGE
jgi:hypothetical protein